MQNKIYTLKAPLAIMVNPHLIDQNVMSDVMTIGRPRTIEGFERAHQIFDGLIAGDPNAIALGLAYSKEVGLPFVMRGALSSIMLEHKALPMSREDMDQQFMGCWVAAIMELLTPLYLEAGDSFKVIEDHSRDEFPWVRIEVVKFTDPAMESRRHFFHILPVPMEDFEGIQA